jgi:hypothetical protein
MSRAAVETAIDKLLTERTLRLRFALDPITTVVDLYLWGIDLTGEEIELLGRTDPRLWVPQESVRWEVRN